MLYAVEFDDIWLFLTRIREWKRRHLLLFLPLAQFWYQCLLSINSPIPGLDCCLLVECMAAQLPTNFQMWRSKDLKRNEFFYLKQEWMVTKMLCNYSEHCFQWRCDNSISLISFIIQTVMLNWSTKIAFDVLWFSIFLFFICLMRQLKNFVTNNLNSKTVMHPFYSDLNIRSVPRASKLN